MKKQNRRSTHNLSHPSTKLDAVTRNPFGDVSFFVTANSDFLAMAENLPEAEIERISRNKFIEGQFPHYSPPVRNMYIDHPGLIIAN